MLKLHFNKLSEGRNTLSIQMPVPVSILSILHSKFLKEDEYAKALTIIMTMIFKHQRSYAPMVHYLDYSRTLKRKIVGASKYYTLWGKLVSLGIIQENIAADGTTFSTAKRKCKSLRINPFLLNAKVSYVDFEPYTKNLKISEEPICQQVGNVLGKVQINIACPELKSLSSKLAERHLKSKMKMTVNGFSYTYNKKTLRVNMNKSEANSYMDYEKINIAQSYILNLHLIDNHYYWVNRTSTNDRLFHNLVNLPSELLSTCLLDQEEMNQKDLRNSQPRFLAFLLEIALSKSPSILGDRGKISNSSKLDNSSISDLIKSKKSIEVLVKVIATHIPPILCSSKKEKRTSDIMTFIEKAKEGKVYEYYALQLYGTCTEQQRDEAKHAFISALYSKRNSSKKANVNFRRVFPDLSELLDQIKKEMEYLFDKNIYKSEAPELNKYLYSKRKGKKSTSEAGNDFLAIVLQEIESVIFIDYILCRLLDNGILALPKHDAILCKKTDSQKVEKIIRQTLDSILGENKYAFKSTPLATKINGPNHDYVAM